MRRRVGDAVKATPAELRAARRSLTDMAAAMGYLASRVTFTHRTTTAPGATGPTLAAWADALGVGRSTLAGYRSRDPELAALPLARRGDATRFGA